MCPSLARSLPPSQAVLLLSFQSEGESQDFPSLKERLNVPVEQMKPLLHSLSCGKYKVGRQKGRAGGRE